jgi:N-acetylmuramoyl-L-alanine amidase
VNIVPLTAWREARSEGQAGMTAVLFVIENRSMAKRKMWPTDPEQICLQRKQFSCWNDNDPQRDLYPADNDKEYELAEIIYSNVPDLADPTDGATAYYDASIPPPEWAKPENFTVQIGKLRFYKV